MLNAWGEEKVFGCKLQSHHPLLQLIKPEDTVSLKEADRGDRSNTKERTEREREREKKRNPHIYKRGRTNKHTHTTHTHTHTLWLRLPREDAVTLLVVPLVHDIVRRLVGEKQRGNRQLLFRDQREGKSLTRRYVFTGSGGCLRWPPTPLTPGGPLHLNFR